MKQKFILPIIVLIFLVVASHFASALNVDSEYVVTFPGDENSVKLEVKNTLDYDLYDVSVKLVLDNLPFTSVGSSEKVKDIDEDDKESFTFTLKSSTDITPGDYNIPYKITYLNDNDSTVTETGTFGLRVSAKTEIDFSAETTNAIIGQQGKVNLKIINKGLGGLGFVSVEVFPQGYELISPEKVYIGTIDSDDSDFASFDVVFNSAEPILIAKVDYRDFDNNEKSQTVNLPFNVYTREKALELGLIQKTSYTIYIVIGVVIVGWLVWRKVKKNKKKNKIKNGGM